MKRIVSLAFVFAALLPLPTRAGLPSAVEEQLEAAQYVYIASKRQDGSLGQPAEIWFLYHKGAVYVGTRPTSWRVKRIRWGRPQAKIWVGKPDGPSFLATGAVVDEPETHGILFETFARKYPEGWPKHESQFRAGFKDGSRVLVKYTLTEGSPQPASQRSQSEGAKSNGRDEDR